MKTFLSLFLLISFCSVAVSATNQHPLSTWEQRPVQGDFLSVAFGNGIFLAAGSTLARSTNGADWVIDSNFANLKAVRFAEGRFFVVGVEKLFTSIDGLQWQVSNLPTNTMYPQPHFWDVAAGGGLIIVAGYTNYVSSNGVDWVPTRTFGFEAVRAMNGGFMGIRVGDYMHLKRFPTAASTNGLDWFETCPLSATFPMGDASAPLGFVADMIIQQSVIVATGVDGPSYKLWSSSDRGATWIRQLPPANSQYYGRAIAYGDGNYLYVPAASGISVLTSTNSTQWNLIPQSRPINSAYQPHSAAYGYGTFVAVGWSNPGGSIYQSGIMAPFITLQPQDRTTYVGRPASFTVEAFGALPLSFRWYKGGAAIPNATNSTYTIATTSAGDTGAYTVVLSNSWGSVTSRVAQLNVGTLSINMYAGVTILGTTGRTYRVEASPASSPLQWVTLTNFVLPTSPYIFFDRQSPYMNERLYRAAEFP